MKVSCKVTGIKPLIGQIRDLQKRTSGAALDSAAAAGARIIMGGCQGHCPVDTGALLASIHVAKGDEGFGQGFMAGAKGHAEVIAGEGLRYAHYQEFGGGRGRHTPFMAPGFEETRAAAVAAVTAAVMRSFRV